MFKSIAKAINQNKKNKLVKLITVLSVFYIFTPYISHATPECTGDSKFFMRKDKIKFMNTSNIGHQEKSLEISSDMSCSKITPQDVGEKIVFRLVPTTTPIFISSDTFDSGISGIGIRIEEMYQNPECSFDSTKLEYTCEILNNHQRGVKYMFLVYLYIVKLNLNHGIGEFSSPTYSGEYYVESNGPGSAKRINIGNNNSQKIEITSNTCTLNTLNIDFNLGEQQQKDFTGMGSKGRENTNKIALTCDPNTKYSLKIDGDAEPGHQSVLKLTPEPGAASGVGVQLLVGNNKDPMEIGKAKEMGITASTGTDIKKEIDITARYYQTENKVTPGTANASATFTMTYQ
ncbi:fimbrial protein [Yersinia artesiana]|uniref:fimbrial protein n=1 Tax=Yersinia artesiana TaxID=2890315 RepID=UPI001D10186A|nr:fimbrial protein [Yersinia artesiana]